VDIASGKTRFLTMGRKTAVPDGRLTASAWLFSQPDGDKRNQIFVLDLAGGDALR